MGKSKAPAKTAPASGLPRGWGELFGVALLAIGALMVGGLFSYQFGDGTLMGPVGRLVAGALYAGFGMASYLIALGVLGVGLQALLDRPLELRLGEGLGFSGATLAGCVLLHVTFSSYRVHGYTAGGLTGELLGEVCLGLFDAAGTYVVAAAVLCAGLVASTPLSTRHLVAGAKAAGRGLRAVLVYLWDGAVSIARAQREAWDEAAEESAPAPVPPPSTRGRPDADVLQTHDEDPVDDEAEADEGEQDQDQDADPADEESEDDEDEDGEGQEDDARRATPAPAVARPARPRKNRKLDEERPEIVLVDPDAEEPPVAPIPRAGKKAPPRAAELAVRPVPAVAPGPPAPASRHRRGQVQYLKGTYELPPLLLFEAAEKVAAEVDKEFVYQQADRIVEALAHFKIRGKVTKVHPGPVITRYEFRPEAGTKLSRIANLENDLAMALEAVRIRILAPIPGRNTVGFEVPNKTRETVYVQEILEDKSFGEFGKAKLPLGLGKDITGKAVSIDLARAPHLLVAGATGAGKSVGVNAMICSLLHTRTPEDLRLILIDPKRLEFSLYEDIPHLMLPVITDAEKANNALKWAVNEMERRYELLSEAKVRDIGGYNAKVPQLQAEWEAERHALAQADAEARDAVAQEGEEALPGSMLSGTAFDREGVPTTVTAGAEPAERPDRLPYIVIIIDEFADLMMVASKDVEANVARIAAKARAAGVHLIVATQRPSVDVITGTIKNNFPTRIAFQVTSDTDSRTILDQNGAKQLLGQGDMLYMDRGKEPTRVHGCFVSEREIEKVVDFIKKQARPAYNLDITRAQETAPEEDDLEELPRDPLYDKAVRLVGETQKCSTSLLQRRLGIGYGRAAKIVDMMESEGVIGPAQGPMGKRDIHVSAA
jgi:S-DNA-T family DNA segregation ATPase FtsK/SpoIIIE